MNTRHKTATIVTVSCIAVIVLALALLLEAV